MTRLRTPPRSLTEKIDQLSARAESLERQLIRSQRLATLGTLSVIMAHEVNNQLTSVMNHADLALGRDDQAAVQRSLQKILTSSEMSSKMIRNMMDFANGGTGEKERLDGARLVEDSLNLMARKPAKDGIAVECRADEGLHVVGSPVELMQVLLNLIMNAVQAMEGSGGTLSLTVRRDDGFVAFDVADTGPGIAEETLASIFEPFFTTKKARDRQGGGTGLGLYISRSIARKFGGDIAVTSTAGQGTTFTLYLPAAD
jgi:signal transduction histidine kinase